MTILPSPFTCLSFLPGVCCSSKLHFKSIVSGKPSPVTTVARKTSLGFFGPWKITQHSLGQFCVCDLSLPLGCECLEGRDPDSCISFTPALGHRTWATGMLNARLLNKWWRETHLGNTYFGRPSSVRSPLPTLGDAKGPTQKHLSE